MERATKIDAVKDIRDKAEAVRLYKKQSGDSLAAQNAAAEIKIRAERRGGELLREMERSGKRRPAKGGRKKHLHDERVSIADMGLTHTESHRWQQIASVPEKQFEHHMAETVESGQELTSKGVYRLAGRRSAKSRSL